MVTARRWLDPNRCWIKLNTDEATEARAILEGPCLAWEKEFRHLELECDNAFLVKVVLAGGATD
ncbi:hypothetical protein Gogos_000828, partial [Gossypium gossypioides]|nr:hypothetical protein [Gossypium gossypioides]